MSDDDGWKNLVDDALNYVAPDGDHMRDEWSRFDSSLTAFLKQPGTLDALYREIGTSEFDDLLDVLRQDTVTVPLPLREEDEGERFGRLGWRNEGEEPRDRFLRTGKQGMAEHAVHKMWQAREEVVQAIRDGDPESLSPGLQNLAVAQKVLLDRWETVDTHSPPQLDEFTRLLANVYVHSASYLTLGSSINDGPELHVRAYLNWADEETRGLAELRAQKVDAQKVDAQKVERPSAHLLENLKRRFGISGARHPTSPVQDFSRKDWLLAGPLAPVVAAGEVAGAIADTAIRRTQQLRDRVKGGRGGHQDDATSSHHRKHTHRPEDERSHGGPKQGLGNS